MNSRHLFFRTADALALLLVFLSFVQTLHAGAFNTSPSIFVAENARVSYLPVYRIDAWVDHVTLNVRFESLTAIAGTDFDATPVQIKFTEANSAASFPITVYDNRLRNEDRQFRIVYSDPSGSSQVPPPTIVTISDDDYYPVELSKPRWIGLGPNGAVVTENVNGLGFGKTPLSIVARDFNNDGFIDIATGDYEDSTISIIFGAGNSQFFAAQPPTVLNLGGHLSTIASGDFDGDGNADLVGASETRNDLELFRGDGIGGFTPWPSLDLGENAKPKQVIAADLNKDGRADLVVTCYEQNILRIFLGDGHGGFIPAPIPTVATGNHPWGVCAGDLNGDGIPDIACTNEEGASATKPLGKGSISLFQGDGTGRFTVRPGSPLSDFANSVLGARPVSLAIGDLNQDGRADLVIANRGAHTISLMYGASGGGFVKAPGYPFETWAFPRWVELADLNHDGLLDIACATEIDTYGIGTVGMLINRGPASPPKLTQFESEPHTGSLAVADVDRDGKLDIVGLNYGAAQPLTRLSLFLNKTPELPTDEKPRITILEAEANENAGAAVVRIYRDFGLDKSFEFNLDTVAGAPLEGIRFSPVHERVGFEPGQRLATVLIPLVNDSYPEGAVSFQLASSNPSIPLELQEQATVTIHDEDGSPIFGVESPTTLSESALTHRFNVVRYSGIDNPRMARIGYEVRIQEGNGSILLTNGVLEFPTGETNRVIEMLSFNDDVVNQQRTLRIDLINVDGWQFYFSPGTSRVLDDESGSVALKHSLGKFLVSTVSRIKAANDGNVYLGCYRSTDGGASMKPWILKLKTDGTLDLSFGRGTGMANIETTNSNTFYMGDIVETKDGRLIIKNETGGSFLLLQAGADTARPFQTLNTLLIQKSLITYAFIDTETVNGNLLLRAEGKLLLTSANGELLSESAGIGYNHSEGLDHRFYGLRYADRYHLSRYSSDLHFDAQYSPPALDNISKMVRAESGRLHFLADGNGNRSLYEIGPDGEVTALSQEPTAPPGEDFELRYLTNGTLATARIVRETWLPFFNTPVSAPNPSGRTSAVLPNPLFLQVTAKRGGQPFALFYSEVFYGNQVSIGPLGVWASDNWQPELRFIPMVDMNSLVRFESNVSIASESDPGAVTLQRLGPTTNSLPVRIRATPVVGSVPDSHNRIELDLNFAPKFGELKFTCPNSQFQG